MHFLEDFQESREDLLRLKSWAYSVYKSFQRDDPWKTDARRLYGLIRDISTPEPLIVRHSGPEPLVARHSGPEPSLLESHTRWLDSAWNKFFERSWFSRTWVVQEVLLSSRAVVLLGDHRYSWDLVIVASQLLELVARFRPAPEGTSRSRDGTVPRSKSPPFADRMSKTRSSALQGAALLAHVELTRPLVVTAGRRQWPIPWKRTGVFVQDCVSMSGIRYTSLEINSTRTNGQRSAATELCELLEQSANLQCYDPRDKVFALLGMFEGQLPVDLKIDYAKSIRDIFIDLSFFLLSRGHFATLSLACIIAADRPSAYPSWAIDWQSYSKEQRKAFSRRFRDPSMLDSHDERFELTTKRRGSVISMRGRLLHDPIDEVSELHPGDSSTLRIRTKSGFWSIATSGVRRNDVMCLFHGCDRPFVLRSRRRDGWRLVAQSRVTHFVTQDRAGSSAGNLDWCTIIAGATQSEVEDIWIY